MNNLKKHPKNNGWLLPQDSEANEMEFMKQLSPTKTETLKETSHAWSFNVPKQLYFPSDLSSSKINEKIMENKNNDQNDF